MIKFNVSTRSRTDFIDITSDVSKAVSGSGVKEGIAVVFVPHTTCSVTINEHADPAVVEDIEGHLAKAVPPNRGYRHSEGNADSHIKTSMFGSSETIIVEGGRLVLGTWQGIFLADFDGPRTRKVFVKVIEG